MGAGGSPGDGGFDETKYVSRAEYMRDVQALRHAGVKSIVALAAGVAIGSFNAWFIRFMEQDHELDWIVNNFAMDQIMAYLLVLVVLLVPGVWIGVAKHRRYSMLYFAGFSVAGVAFMLDAAYFIPGLYVFVVSFFLLWIVYLIFFKIWLSVKRTVARARADDVA